MALEAGGGVTVIDDVALVGVGMHPWGKWGRPFQSYGVHAARAALSDAGLVTARREGRETRYTLTPAPLADAMRWMTEVGAEWDERLARLARRA